MNIVILTPIPFWHPGTQELVDQLKNFGIEVRALDIFYGKMMDNEGKIYDLTPSFPFKILEKVYLRLVRNKIISGQIYDGDIVDIHFLEPAYGRYIEQIKKRKVKLITTLFGSDLFRTNDEQKQSQSAVFEKSDAIVLSENMVPYFEKHFPGYEKKYRFNQYGSARLEKVSELNSAANKQKFREKYGIENGKIVLSCGYNGKREQQHLKMLDEIEKLSPSDKERVFLIFSMTYGREDLNYVEEVKLKLKNSGISHLCFENKLSDREIAEIRIISDITINTQTTDALASTIKEAMVAGDVMLVGDWLPYNIYKKLGVFYLTASFEKLAENLKNILDNLEEFQKMSEKNANLILDFASWRVLITKWVKLYKEIEQKECL